MPGASERARSVAAMLAELLHSESSTGRQDCFVLTHGAAVIAVQLAEHYGGENGHGAQNQKSLVDAVDHFRGTAVKAVGNEDRGDERCRCYAETYRHLLH